MPGEHGNFTRPVNFRKRYYRILAAAGIEKKGLHSLRHTFATLALQNGVDVKTVSSILGHFSAGFTLDTYAHVTTTAQREAAKKMDGGAGAEGAMRKIPGAGMRRYPLQSLTQTQGKTVWVRYGSRRKTTSEPRSSEVVLSCRFSRKNSAIYTTDTAKSRERAGSIPQKGKRKPQVTKPGVFGCGGRI